VKCQTTHSRRRGQWSTLIEPGMWPPNSPNLNLVNYADWDVFQQMAYQCWWFTTVNQLKQAIVAEWGKLPQRLVNRASGVAVLDASSRSKANTLNIWCKIVRHDFLDNNWDSKHVVSVVYFLKYIAAKIVLFSIVTLKTLTFHKVVQWHTWGAVGSVVTVLLQIFGRPFG